MYFCHPIFFLNEGPLEKRHLLKGYPSYIYQIKSNHIKSNPLTQIADVDLKFPIFRRRLSKLDAKVLCLTSLLVLFYKF